jgi:2-keto-3-deoxy-L-rhamnonate aldolase RhmA
MISDMRNPEIARILAASGMDFLMLDMEHSSGGLESSQEIVRAALSAGIVPLARVTENQYPFIS